MCVCARARVCVRVESGRIHGATVTHFNETDRTSYQKVVGEKHLRLRLKLGFSPSHLI